MIVQQVGKLPACEVANGQFWAFHRVSRVYQDLFLITDPGITLIINSTDPKTKQKYSLWDLRQNW